jgi:voltage-gated sodium channel
MWEWNNFDFWLMCVCWVPPSLLGGDAAFLRIIRLMRLFKIVRKIKQLQVIVTGLVKGLKSVKYIMLLMCLVFYLYAVLGVSTFRKNDPFHFGGVGMAMLTLFRIATLDNWTMVWYLTNYGCDSQYDMLQGVSTPWMIYIFHFQVSLGAEC